MAIQPLDLQTLFAQMNHVSKIQASQRELPLINQALQAREIAQAVDEHDHSVNKTEQSEDNTPVDRDGHGSDAGAEEGEAKERQEADKEDRPVTRCCFRDPKLGRYLDISG